MVAIQENSAASPLGKALGKKGPTVTITHPRRYRQYSTPTRRGDPVAEIEQLQDQMGQIISNFFRDPMGALGSQQPPLWVPSADVEETDDSYVLEVDLPGVNRDDVKIELRDNEVRITGELKEKERTGVLRRQTRRVGQFEFMVTLPGDIDPDKVDASLHDGVLTVRLAKAAASQPRQIEVKET
jgi:HSP20 family protein